MSEELFREELIAMHLHEQASKVANRHPLWFKETPDNRRKFRLQAKMMIAEAKEPRG